MSLVRLSCRRYEPRGTSRALPWRIARRRSGSLTVAGLRGGLPWGWGGLAGPAFGVWRVHVDVCVVLGGLAWAGRCWVVPRLRGGWSWCVTGACGGGVLRWVFLWGALMVSWRSVDGLGGACVGYGAG